MSLGLRSMEPRDAEAVSRLSGELGYPVDTDEMRERILSLGSERAAWVAVSEGGVVGWAEARVCSTLAGGRRAEITGLIVSERLRGRKIGEKLVEEAECWATARALSAVRVSSRATREGAHRFYRRLGYELVKTAGIFLKPLRSES